MIRLFLPPEQLTSRQITISSEQARYLSRVLRIKPGELITILDGKGYRHICRVSKIHKKEVLVEKIKEEAYSAESPLSIILAQGVPKGEKMDFIIQKSTELGVKIIIPIISERSEVKETAKLGRWKKIALSASGQSGREKIPDIEKPVSFKEFLTNLPLPPFPKGGLSRDYSKGENLETPTLKKGDIGGFFDKNHHGIIFSEEEKNQDLKKVLKNLKEATTITLLIGPEGGFSPAELTMAVNKGFIPASLGPRILRTETAAITAISIIQYELGDMG